MYFFLCRLILSQQTVHTMMKCRMMRHFIWVFTDCQFTRLGFCCLQRVNLFILMDFPRMGDRKSIASVTFATGIIRFICLGFSVQFFRHCRWLHCLRSLCDFFRRQTVTDLAEIVWKRHSHCVILAIYAQISHDASAMSLQVPYDHFWAQ